MKDRIELSGQQYVSIKLDNMEFYGGNQSWWEKTHRLFASYGCGVIAMADLQAYILGNDRLLYKEYVEYVDVMYSKYYHFITPIGLPFWTMAIGFRKYMKNMGKDAIARWAPYFNKEKLKKIVYKMISENKPIPASFHSFTKSGALIMYSLDSTSGQLIESQRMISHYFVITGINKIGNTVYIKIASWGNVYYISMSEWLRKISIFTNILYWDVQ